MTEFLHWIYRIWRILLNILSWAVTLVLLVVSLSLLTFQLRPVKQLLLDEVLNRVNSTLQGEITANQLSGFLPFSLQLYDVTLYSEKVLSDTLIDYSDPLIVIPEVRVQLDLSELIGGTISIRSFRAIRPAIHSHWDRVSGKWDLAEALSGGGSTDETRTLGESTDVDSGASSDSLISIANSDTLRAKDPGITRSLYIPEISIENGIFELVQTGVDDDGMESVDSIRVDQIFTSLFFESNPDRRVIDLMEFSASLSSFNKNSVQISGQLFQDPNTTELNGLRIRTLGSELYLNASAAISLDESIGAVMRQKKFQNRDFEIRLDRAVLDVPELATFGLPLPATELPEKIELDIQLSNRDGITFLDELELFSGNSYANFEGKIDLNSWDRDLVLSLVSAEVDPADFPTASQIHKLFSVLPDLRIRGELSSERSTSGVTKSGLVAELTATQRDIQSQALVLVANLTSPDQWNSFQTGLSLNLDSLYWELSPLLGDGVDLPSDLDDDETLWELLRTELSLPSLISGEIVASFQYSDQEFSFVDLTGNLSDNQIGSLNLGGLSFFASSQEDTLNYELDGGFSTTQLTSKGTLVAGDLNAPLFFGWWNPTTVQDSNGRDQDRWTQITTVTDLRLSELLPTFFQDKTVVSLLLQSDLDIGFPEYGSGTIRLLTQNLTFQGRQIDDLSLLASLEQTTDTISTFSLLSNLGQLTFAGELSPLSLPESIRQISQSFSDKVGRQSFGLLNLPLVSPSRNQLQGKASGQPKEEILKGEFQIELQDLNPITQFINSIQLESHFQANGSIDLTPSELSLQSKFKDSLFKSTSFTASNFSGSLEMLYYPEKELTQQNRVLLDVSLDSVSVTIGQMKNVAASLSLLREDIALTIDSEQDPELFHLNLSSLLELQKDELELDLLALKAGKGEYEWVLPQPAGISYSRGEVISFRSFELENQSQKFQLNGTFSRAPGDSISLGIERLDLGEISDFLPGRLEFDGIVNGQIAGTFPAGIPVIFGQMKIDGFELNDRPVGDFSLNSVYDPDLEQFNIDARLFTDLSITETVNGVEEPVGQDFVISGYVRNPASSAINLPKFDLQAEFNRIDLWILEELLPNLIVSSKGIATGKARLFDPVREGPEARPLLEGNAEIVNAELVPLFLNTRYAVSGQLSYSNRSGFDFNTLLLRDPFGGEARLSGLAGLTSLEEPIPLTLALQMNRFQFINNPYNPDLPFYATVNGSGTLQLSGNSQNPVLRTPNPLQVTTNSRVSIPLLDVISVSQDNKFITFVDEFESWNAGEADLSSRVRAPGSTPAKSQASEFSFTDQFTMDLQFVAQEPIRFEMIFDRITNEAISGNGTGQMRLTLQDGNYQLFGAVDLSSGEYNFVSGDILTRRFQLEEGGRVVWDGNPTNAQLNVQAVYRARPPLSTLGVVSASSADQLGTGQRIPIELVLQIFGSMDQIQNEFFFRIPTGIAGFSDPTLATRISSLNRNQEEKLVQAFSILLTGNFIPTGESTFENTSVLSGLTGSAVLINPFVSTQLLSPLLSNQINSLLNENVTFDVDVNIDAYNEVELAVALRLYNDRLVLRREGQITGDQNRLGDLGATYRINRVISLTAFHRQDPTFTSNTGQASGDGGDNQVINGVGVEARFQFHTWKEFFRRLTSWMRRDESVEET